MVTTASTIFFVLAAVAAVADWTAVAKRLAILEYVSKPTATVAFLLAVASLDVGHDGVWWWRIAALAFCIAGDVFLMLPRDAFIPGLASFAIAQVLFTISFAVGETNVGRAAIGMVVVVPVALLLARRFIGAIKVLGHDALVVPVVAYMVVISAMAVGSIAAGSAIAIAGAVVFMLSDSLIAETRFVKERAWQPVGIMVTYHVALVGLVLGLL